MVRTSTRIAILVPDLRGGGAERVMLDLAREFARHEHRVEFVLMQARGDFLREAHHDFDVYSLDTPRIRNVATVLARYLCQRRPSALIVAMWPLTVIAPVAARMAGFRGSVVVSEHAILSQQYSALGALHRIVRRARQSHTCCAAWCTRRCHI